MDGSDSNAGGEPDVPICALTEFRLRGSRCLLPTYLDYRRVVAQARATSGGDLLGSRFLIEDARTWVSLSIWSNADAIPNFGTDVPLHHDAARRLMRRVARDAGGRPEFWSSKWALISASGRHPFGPAAS
jgi:hypothetical protein